MLNHQCVSSVGNQTRSIKREEQWVKITDHSLGRVNGGKSPGGRVRRATWRAKKSKIIGVGKEGVIWEFTKSGLSG